MKNKQILVAIIGFLGLMVLFSIPSTTYYEKPPENPPQAEILATSTTFKEVKIEIVKKAPEITLLPALEPICTCESGQGTGKPQHYDVHTGEVLRGQINPDDIGMCQINLFYHEAKAKRMNIDIFSKAGNIEYANQLYEAQGSQPWAWSQHCWAGK